MLEVEHLTVYFHMRNGIVRAVDDVSFFVTAGETLGIVGESGSGKTVTCLSLLGLIPSPPAIIDAGSAFFDGNDLLTCTPKQMRQLRGNQISIIFQDPMTSLNPYLSIEKQLCEHVIHHRRCSRKSARRQAIECLGRVEIPDPKRCLRNYPHALSGGMRQRVMIAMALITNPKLIIADEPTTALDVTIQAQILEVLKSVQANFGPAVIFVSHDLGVIARMADRVMVMYAGKVVESGPVTDVFRSPYHPYTRALLDALPTHWIKKKLYAIPGMPPDMSATLRGCSFAPRCRNVAPKCWHESPRLVAVDNKRICACLNVLPNANDVSYRTNEDHLNG